MDAKQAKNLISKGKGISIEFKTSQEELTKSGFETAVAFLNTIGRYIFLGVDDDGNLIGIDEDKISSMELDFANLINSKNKVNPPVPLALQEIYIDSKCILYVYIPSISEVHKLNNSIIYERADDGDRDITENTYAVKRLYARKSGRSSEEIVYPDITFDDFNKERIAKAKKLIGINNAEGNWDNLSAEEILKQRSFYRQDPDTGKQGYTLASLLLFRKKESIIGKLSGYKVDVIKRIKNTERYDDRYICEENLIG